MSYVTVTIVWLSKIDSLHQTSFNIASPVGDQMWMFGSPNSGTNDEKIPQKYHRYLSGSSKAWLKHSGNCKAGQ